MRENFPSNLHCDLQRNILVPENLRLGDEDILTYLNTIGHYKHPLHDGFHFINELGVLTHVAQYFIPPISYSVDPILGQGARVFTAGCGSLVEGVILSGTISSKNKLHVFKNGQLLFL